MKILFIGNFLSEKRGTLGPTEGVIVRLSNKFTVLQASVYTNKILKLADMLIKSAFLNYDVIHIDTYSTTALHFAYYCATIGKLRHRKVILNLHGGGLFNLYKMNTQKSRYLEQLFLKASDIVSPSLYLKDMFGSEGFKIQYLPNTVDSLYFPYNTEIVNNHKILWVRAFNATYQPWLAVKTLYEVRKKYPDTTLTMVGPDKGLLSETMELIVKLGLKDAIEIKGKVPNNELNKYYSTHRIFLNTTNTESFGVAVMEAASCGIPIVTTSVGELPYIWQNEENALLVETNNEIDFSVAVSKLFDDKLLYQKLKRNARAKAESFDWEVVKNKWIELLR